MSLIASGVKDWAERRFHLGDAEDAGAGAGHRDAHPAAGAGDEHADDRIARSRVAEFLIIRGLRFSETGQR